MKGGKWWKHKTRGAKTPRYENTRVRKSGDNPALFVRLGLWQTDHALAVFELAAFFEQIDTFKTLEYIALGCDRAGSF